METKRNEQGLLTIELGFPVYAVEYSTITKTVFVAGGGGPSKSGVRNSMVPARHYALLMSDFLLPKSQDWDRQDAK